MRRSGNILNFSIVIGSDHRGFKAKRSIIEFLKNKGFKLEDFGTFSEESCDYTKYAYKVAKAVGNSRRRRGILICKTGIGNSIAANKVKGVRAALCYNVKAARLSREHNNANVLVLGADFIRRSQLKRILETWLKTEFIGGRHLRRINQIRKIERGQFKP
jgi:ribose 5-phosphate isomerase B